MGERRHTTRAAVAPAMPTLPDYAEAYRNVHNLQAQYESLGTLKEVIGVLAEAQRQYDAILLGTSQAQEEQERARAELQLLHDEQHGLADDITKERTQAEAAHAKLMAELTADEAAIQEPLTQARAELAAARVEAALIKDNITGEAQRVAAAIRGEARAEVERLHHELAALKQEVAQLTATRARMMADLSEAIGKVELVRGA
jgi:chromosome segregation ATPase